MKKTYMTLLLLLSVLFSSCLKDNLDEIEVYKDADITSVRGLYYYFNTEVSASGSQLFDWGPIQRGDVQIDNKANTVVIGTAKPAQNNIDQFDAKKVIMMLTISTAATIEPIEGSSVLGVESDWTAGKVNKYKVTAADGSSKVWSVSIANYAL